ncbi:PilX N-terminal domain-containing pilus assembly protein [Parahaliea mediterranea]|uniref:PilX N-terminal domain-containing pilus assembly protein n=1 Tax=Parahaliea mediterranea TaxID=651086 RepID=UPI000E2E8BCA|nr:PilX N-terminal domain-containing pilus assembly protein [Parahaliea mediterranea]
MKRSSRAPVKGSQAGIALVVSLLFLLVVTVISITAASNSAFNLKMSSNMQDSYQSFQAAEAGVYATVALGRDRGGANDPFFSSVPEVDPFDGMTTHPLLGLATSAGDPNSIPVDVRVIFVTEADCPRPPEGRGGSSGGINPLLPCNYYRVVSGHDIPGRARSRVELGVAAELLNLN